MTAAIEDEPPQSPSLTDYDRTHLALYLRLLDAESAGADWREVATMVLGVEPAANPDRARRIHQSHLDRAKWIRDSGFMDLLKS